MRQDARETVKMEEMVGEAEQEEGIAREDGSNDSVIAGRSVD